VAIKLYKEQRWTHHDGTENLDEDKTTTEIKFFRQIKVLKQLTKPFSSDNITCEGKARIHGSHPTDLFVRLLDHSPSTSLEKYIVTEAGAFTLNSMLRAHATAKQTLKTEQVLQIAQAILLALGALHEKCLVHCDFKPDNIMFFGDHWKLIDVDGCMSVGKYVNCRDETLSFTATYCAPEWARFVAPVDGRTALRVETSLDSWSVGMTLAELISLEPPLKFIYNKMAIQTSRQEQRPALSEFLRYFGSMKEVPLPECLDSFHTEYAKMIRMGLLALVPSKRLTMAECLEDALMQPLNPLTQVVKGDAEVHEMIAIGINSKIEKSNKVCSSQTTTTYASPSESMADMALGSSRLPSKEPNPTYTSEVT